VTNADCPVTVTSDPAVASTTTVGCPVGAEVCTPPEGAASFSTFIPCATAAVGTKWHLVDSRDSKTYTVVKMPDTQVWMAQNLNYQKNLTWQQYAKDPSTVSGVSGTNPDLIGHFWCPGGHVATISTEAGCNIWGGALYPWVTAMSLDGKGNGSWTEVATYGIQTNHGRTDNEGTTIGGRGICPENWHVPTGTEWGTLLNAMEDEESKKYHITTSDNWVGAIAGSRIKSTATVATYAGATDTDPSWTYNVDGAGTDKYGFRVLPVGFRQGALFYERGLNCVYWSSDVCSSDLLYSLYVRTRLNLVPTEDLQQRCK
jgi:uncharacterized protein (TIGR02145 family)